MAHASGCASCDVYCAIATINYKTPVRWLCTIELVIKPWVIVTYLSYELNCAYVAITQSVSTDNHCPQFGK